MKHIFRWLPYAIALLSALPGLSQTVWHDPLNAPSPVIRGQGWTDELQGTYNRLPERTRNHVRPSLWRLSQHSAGLALCFRTNSPTVRVRCRIEGPAYMEHMPATGVSGFDLYSEESGGGWRFLKREFAWSPGDTVAYAFHPVPGPDFDRTGCGFLLYLPLYAHVRQLEIGTDARSDFEWVPQPAGPSIVAYGTSILQGGCASRPGMAWTNILSRRIGRTVMNFGFSGNGQMDTEILALLGELDAALYLIDCLPNLEYTDDAEVCKKYLEGVRSLRSRSKAPILLVEHTAGIADYDNPSARRKNALLRECFLQLRAEGAVGLYYLSCAEIALPADGTVDGIHPNDLGMAAIAAAYERKIHRILRRH